ncbi:uncharacterized protein JCM15063_004260 [Sporobolomyces koalae]|uniref:uncharacterized protein n=1 Tax=Sporobolomyces koalae TaxID=500713 RepID=UPI003181A786
MSARYLVDRSTALEKIRSDEKVSVLCHDPGSSTSSSARTSISTPERSQTPDSAYSDERLLNPYSTPLAAAYAPSSRQNSISTQARYFRRLFWTQRWNSRVMALVLSAFAACVFFWPENRRDPRRVMFTVRGAADSLRERQCRLFPRMKSCSDPFRRLKYTDDSGLLVYPAKLADPASAPTLDANPTPPPQPHPIHYLIHSAETLWNEKVACQSRTLSEAVAEYTRRYGQAPPRGFDAWFAFATRHNVPLIDEYDSIHRQILPFAALSPEILRKRNAMLQNTTGEEELWLHQHTVTVKIREHGQNVTADGPMRKVNYRADQLLELLKGISEFLPDLDLTITGHDVPWVTMSGEAKEEHTAAAQRGQWIDDIATYVNDWSLEGFQTICPPNSPIRAKGSIYERLEPVRPDAISFIGLDHRKTMDICNFPDNQPLHGYTSWNGPRPGILFPLFSWTSSTLNTDFLLPALEQYERAVGPDPIWSKKKYNKAVWRGSTTGSDLTIAHARKYSQRVRLARVPLATGEVTVPLAKDDGPNLLGPVQDYTASARAFANAYLDIKFQGRAQQCGDAESCARFEKDFEWDGFMSEEEQNQYKYVIDVDGNGWSGRFHRLMASNSLVLKSTIFPEWYADRVQPWVHYVPLKVDYSDLYPILAFFQGSPLDGSGAHEDLAEKIATAGSGWARDFWRWEDMQAYLLRLVLEYARILNRDAPGATNWDYVPLSS